MELKQSAQEYEIPHQLAYYECNELGHPTNSKYGNEYAYGCC